MSNINTEEVHISKIKMDGHNANLGSERGRHQIEASIRKYGFADAGTLDKNNKIIGGNKRTEVSAEIGMDEAIIIDIDGTKPVYLRRKDLDLDDTNSTSARELAYALNRSQEVSLTWDAEVLLADLAAEVPLNDFFFEDELDELIKSLVYEDPTTPGSDTEPDTGRAEELQAEWGTELGQLWQCGPHRLIIGDCTDADVVSRLMGGKTAEICFTSPPYSDMREYRDGVDLSTSNIVNFIKSSHDFVNYFIVNLGIKREDQEIVRYWDDYILAAESVGLKLLSWNVWSRHGFGGSIGNMTAMFPIEHEWIFVFGEKQKEVYRTKENKHGNKVINSTIRSKDGSMKSRENVPVGRFGKLGTIFISDMDRGKKDHPATFPISFPESYIEAMTNESDTVFDPFLGSGTTMIAAHNLKRKCYGCEISPAYGAVILQRFKDHTGIEPELIALQVDL